MLDGELFVALRGADGADRLEFETLQERIHPAASRVNLLAEKTPAGFVAFDLLALGDESYLERPFAERRAALEEALGGLTGPCYLTRTTTDPAEAEEWFTEFEGAGLDGVVAKPLGCGVPRRTCGACSRSSTSGPRTSSWRGTASTRPPRPSGRCSAACCSGCTTTGKLQHVGVSASFTAAPARGADRAAAAARVRHR